MLQVDAPTHAPFHGELTLARRDLSRLRTQLVGLPRWSGLLGVAVFMVTVMTFGGLLGPGVPWERTLMGLLVFLFLTPLVVFALRRKLHSPLAGATLKLAVGEAGVVLASESARGAYPWSAFHSYDLIDDGIVLRMKNSSIQFIFLRAFAPNEREAIIAHVEERLPRSARGTLRVVTQSAFWGAIALGASLSLVKLLQ